MTDNTDTRSPDEIERDIRATQDDMNRTVKQLEGEFTGRNIFNSLLDKADESGVDTRYLIDAVRRNPLALGMIAVGGLWLVSDADARPSALKMSSGGSGSKGSDHHSDASDPDHRAYIDHMARCERQPGEDDQTYRRRRDHSRASYFMIEQGHDEDEGGFRKRLDEATDKLRESRDKASESAREFSRNSRDRAQQAASKAKDFYFDNPMIGGLAAAFAGAIAGSALPSTRTEEAYVGEMGEQALDTAQAKMRQAGNQARQRKDEMLDKVDQKISAGSDQNQQNGSPRAV